MKPESYELFISYAHDKDERLVGKDADREQVREAVKKIHDQLEESLTNELGYKSEIFFDSEDIKDFEHWKRSCFKALNTSKYLVVLVTKKYLDSDACKWEWNYWASLERERNEIGTSSRLMFIAVEKLDVEYNKKLLKVTEELGEGSTVYPTQDWFQSDGALPTDATFYQDKIEPIASIIAERLRSLAMKSKQVGNLGWPNLHFVQRTSLSDQLAVHLHPSQTEQSETHETFPIPLLTGFGKTALAHDFCHHAGQYYPGGVWQLRAANDTDALPLLLNLVQEFDIHFSEEEKIDSEAQLKRLFKERQPYGKTLLLIDNLHHAQLITSLLERLYPQREWISILVTTRLSEEELLAALRKSENPPPFGFQPIEVLKLSMDESLELFRYHQPERKFQTFQGEENPPQIFQEIATELDRHALSIESSAILLGQSDPRISPKEFIITPEDHLAQIRKDLKQVGNIEGPSHIRHLAAIFESSKKRLSDHSIAILHFVAMLPADQIALPWLRELSCYIYPVLAEQAHELNTCITIKDINKQSLESGNPWVKAIRELLHIRLILPTEDQRITTVHRLFHEVLRYNFPDHVKIKMAGFDNSEVPTKEWILFNVVLQLDLCLRNQSFLLDNIWQLEPIESLALFWNKKGHENAHWLLNQVGQYWHNLSDWKKAEPLMRMSLAICLDKYPESHDEISLCQNNLAQLLLRTGRLKEAEPLMKKVLTNYKISKDYHNIAVASNNLALLLQEDRRLEEAKIYLKKALIIDEEIYEDNHINLAIRYNNLATLLLATRELKEAEYYFKKAMIIYEENEPVTQPRYSKFLNNYAKLLQYRECYEESETLFLRSIKIYKNTVGNSHSDYAIALANYAALLQHTKRLDEAENYLLEVCRLDINNDSLAIAYNNLAIIYLEKNKFEQSYLFINNSLLTIMNLAKSKGSHKDLKMITLNFFDIYIAGRTPHEKMISKLAKIFLDSDFTQEEWPRFIDNVTK